MKISALILMLVFTVSVSKGQNNTNSPYSIFGIGELEYSGGARNMSMGESGIALRSPYFLNQNNPASFTAIPQKSFVTDLGINLKYTNLRNNYKSADVINGNIGWFTIAFPVSHKFALGLSLNPKSSVGYTIYSTKTIGGTTTSSPVIYTGAGGLSEASITLGVLLTKKLSFGLKSSFLWGNMTKTTEETPLSLSSVTRIDSTRFSGLNFKSGLQYQTMLASNINFIIGGIAEYGGNLNGTSNMTITTANDATLSQTEQQNLKLPLKAGVGIGFEFNNKYLLTMDYNRSDWRNVSMKFNTNKLGINNSYHLGVEIAPKNDPFRNVLPIRYRIGGLYQTGYLNIYGIQIHSYAITSGLSIPIRSRSFMNFSLEAGRQGTLENQLVRENYLKFNVSFNLFENWFTQRKFD